MINRKKTYVVLMWTVIILSFYFPACLYVDRQNKEADRKNLVITKLVTRVDSLFLIVNKKDSMITELVSNVSKKQILLDTFSNRLDTLKKRYFSLETLNASDRKFYKKQLKDSIKFYTAKIDSIKLSQQEMLGYYEDALNQTNVFFIKSVVSIIVYDDPPNHVGVISETDDGNKATRITINYLLNKKLLNYDSIVPRLIFNNIAKKDFTYTISTNGPNLLINYDFKKGFLAKGKCKMGLEILQPDNINFHFFHPSAIIELN